MKIQPVDEPSSGRMMLNSASLGNHLVVGIRSLRVTQSIQAAIRAPSAPNPIMSRKFQ